MICRVVVGRVEDDAADVDWVDLTWQQTLRRALRLISRAGQRVDVLLPPGGRVKQGDVLSLGLPRVAVWVERIELLAVRSTDASKLARLAFDLGNRHLPAEIRNDFILTPDDGPARAIVAEHGLFCETVVDRFYPERVDLSVILTAG